ncbi:hypothetical protein A0J61_07382 [Choanephora cucurbitarum]|uniref:Uncharacterized protein n=1 Tax=Choanephora cucurbitarum TaxID=101091 RepID=A0A1C7N6A4_9FUNG|nr:hypothetical protein A0J61_07382 [Choanephora cucurbitarum]
MSSRLAKQSLDLLTSTNNKKVEKTDSKKIKLPKTNKGIKKVKYENRYGRHQKTRLRQEEVKKRENPIDRLHEQEQLEEERLKRNVRIMRMALRSSPLEKKIHKTAKRNAKRTKKWSSEVHGSDGDTDSDSD